jgi:creatinine amidohydrolase/Fe(II)-dependent formamide hydrolase-like protein
MGVMTRIGTSGALSEGQWRRITARASGLSGQALLVGVLAVGAAHADQPRADGWRAPLADSSPMTGSVFIEDLTWTEVRDAIASGARGALLYAGSTEQNGPHLAIGKHIFVARRVADAVARAVGTVLVYPIVPFAPTGDPEAQTGHMRFPGSVSLSAHTYALVMAELAASARAAGFTRLYLLGDHAGGENVLARLALELDRAWASGGVRVLHVSAPLDRGEQRTREWLAARGETAGEHAGLPDTALVMAIDPTGQWVRPERFADADAASGVDGDPRGASAALGQVLLQFRVEAAVEQIRAFEASLLSGSESRLEPEPEPRPAQGRRSP